MTTFEMGLVIGVPAILAGLAIASWLLVVRHNRRAGLAAPCGYCSHSKASHTGTGCNAMTHPIQIPHAVRKHCTCAWAYGEVR